MSLLPISFHSSHKHEGLFITTSEIHTIKWKTFGYTFFRYDIKQPNLTPNKALHITTIGFLALTTYKAVVPVGTTYALIAATGAITWYKGQVWTLQRLLVAANLMNVQSSIHIELFGLTVAKVKLPSLGQITSLSKFFTYR